MSSNYSVIYLIMKKIHFEITINAPVEKVWNTMLDDKTYREWTLEFNPGGSWYEGSWEKGSKIKFFGPDPKTGAIGGMTSEIADNRQHEFLSIKHLGLISEGVEIFSGPSVDSWVPSYENYTFTKIDDNTTKIDVDMDSAEEYADMFSEMWPKALAKLKTMCEKS